MNCGRVSGSLLLFFAVVIAIAQNAANENAANGGMPAVDPEVLAAKAGRTATAQNAFGLKLLAALAEAGPRHNVFVSPTSVFLALGMLESGAAGGTRSAIRQALEVPQAASETELRESASALSHSFGQRDGVELSIANALWSDRQITLAAAFIEICKDYYDAEASSLDFADPGAAAAINAWVKQKTGGKISDVVSPRVVAASKAILTNAVYFKGKWQRPFDKKLTRDGPFHLAGGGEKTVPLMHQSDLRDVYRSGDGYEAAVLPYGPPASQKAGTADIVLCAILPAGPRGPEEVMAKLSIADLLSKRQPVELDLALPRFTLDFDASLKDVLGRMGMGVAFIRGAPDFSPLGSRLFFVGDVIHKTRLEVDEEGTVAAAATAVLARRAVVMSPKIGKKTLVFDRPFGLLLCDRRTGAALFAAVVYEPEQAFR
jgi:serine protease inhibitor